MSKKIEEQKKKILADAQTQADKVRAESKNLADAQPERVKAMRTRLESLLKNAVAPGDSVQIKKPISKKQS